MKKIGRKSQKTFLEGISSSFSDKKKLKYFAYFPGLLSEKNPVAVIQTSDVTPV